MVPLRRAVFQSWPLVAAFASAAILAIAHAFQTFGGLLPCELCLKQRLIYWTALIVGLIGFFLMRLIRGRHVAAIACAALALVFLYEAGVAAYHAGVEWKLWPGPQSCTGGEKASIASINSLLGGARIVGPRCDVAAWKFLGLSMAGWNALVALTLAVLSVIAGLKRELSRGQDD